jgi:hypothetical protein
MLAAAKRTASFSARESALVQGACAKRRTTSFELPEFAW